jgi:hypothetical protein
MPYTCACGCTIKIDNVHAIRSHEASLRHLVLISGGSLDDYKFIKGCRSSIARGSKKGVPEKSNRMVHDREVLRLYERQLSVQLSVPE